MRSLSSWQVATITRQYINNLVAPGRMAAGGGTLVEPTTSPAEAPPAVAVTAVAPQVVIPPGAGTHGVDGMDPVASGSSR